MSQGQFWVLAIASSATAIVAITTLVIGVAGKPFKAMRESLAQAVSEVKSETSAIKSDLSVIKNHLRDHDEVLRGIQRGQGVIIESLGEVLPSGTHKAVKMAAEPSNVVSIYSALKEDRGAKTSHG